MGHIGQEYALVRVTNLNNNKESNVDCGIDACLGSLSVLYVDVVTTSAYSNGLGTSPEMWAISARSMLLFESQI